MAKRSLEQCIKNGLRGAFFKSSLKWEATRRFKVAPSTYKCSRCNLIGVLGIMALDHIEAVVEPSVGFVDWNTYVSRLFCNVDNLTLLCKPCHKDKTSAEDAVRRQFGTGRFSKKSLDKMRASKLGVSVNKGVPKSIGHRKALSLERKGKPQTEARKLVLKRVQEESKKPVYGQKIGAISELYFKSIEDASRELGLAQYNISRVCRKAQGRTQTGGWRFRYATKM